MIVFCFLMMTVVAWAAYICKLDVLLLHGRALQMNTVLHVSKQYFIHYYIVGVLVALWLYDTYSTMAILFILHLIRRVIETACMTYSTKMFIGHYLIGHIHYVLALYSIYKPCLWSISIGYYTFILFSILQSRCHYQLVYSNFDSIWFKLFYKPHYTFEMYLYLSIVLFHGNFETLFMFIWVCTNLTISMLSLHPFSLYFYYPRI